MTKIGNLERGEFGIPSLIAQGWVAWVTRGCVMGESALCLFGCCFSGVSRHDRCGKKRLGSDAPLFSFLENMSRWTAKFLLLVLLAGLLAPLATAVTAPAPHCVRKPLTTSTHAEGMAGCHQHAAATPTQVKLGFVSRQCCTGHECCRSPVRSHWAQVNPSAVFGQIDRANDHVATLRQAPYGLELSPYLFVRGPPEL